MGNNLVQIESTDIYTATTNPTSTINPKIKGSLWSNTTDGTFWICTDNTKNKNKWVYINQSMFDNLSKTVEKRINEVMNKMNNIKIVQPVRTLCFYSTLNNTYTNKTNYNAIIYHIDNLSLTEYVLSLRAEIVKPGESTIVKPGKIVNQRFRYFFLQVCHYNRIRLIIKQMSLHISI